MSFAEDFLESGLQRAMIDEFFEEELERAGYGGMEIEDTPQGTRIVLQAEKPGMVIGKGGKKIREMTSILEEEFGLTDLSIDVQEVEEPDLSAPIVASKLSNSLERGWYFRRAGQTTIENIMDAGAQGAEIIFSGKLTGARSRVEKFNRGYIKHNGQPAEELVDHGVSRAVMPLGSIGVKVKIVPPGVQLPDDFEVEDGVEFDEVLEDDLDSLLDEPEDNSEEGDDQGEPVGDDLEDELPDEEEVLPDEEVID